MWGQFIVFTDSLKRGPFLFSSWGRGGGYGGFVEVSGENLAEICVRKKKEVVRA